MKIDADTFAYSMRRYGDMCRELDECIDVVKLYFEIPAKTEIDEIEDDRRFYYRWHQGRQPRLALFHASYPIVEGPWCKDNVHAFVVRDGTACRLVLVDRANNITGQRKEKLWKSALKIIDKTEFTQ